MRLLDGITNSMGMSVSSFPLALTSLIFLQSRDSQESSPTTQFKSINSSVLIFLYDPTLTSIHEYWKKHTGNWVSFSNRLKSKRHSKKCLVSLNMCVCAFLKSKNRKEKKMDTRKARRHDKLEIKIATVNFH